MPIHNTTGDTRTMAEEIIEASPSIAIRVTGDNGKWRTLFITENIASYGYAKADFMSGRLGWNDVVHPDDLAGLIAKIDDFEARGVDRYSTIYRIVRADGTPVWMSDSSHVVRDGNGVPVHSDCIISDYTETKENIDKIEDNYRQQGVLKAILQGLHDSDSDKALQIILDSTGMYLDISRVVLFEDSPDHASCRAIHEWCNKGVSSMLEKGDFVLNYEEDIPEIAADLRTTGVRIVNYGDIPVNSLDEFENEGVIAAAIFSVYVKDEHFGFICFDECEKKRMWSDDTVRFLRNVSKLVSPALIRKKNEQIIQSMALTDQLTGLNNRRHLDVCLNDAITRARELGQAGYVLFIDMDDFKIINDGYGHDYGDAILKEFAAFLNSHFQDGKNIFRFGGDEFVILLEPEKAANVYSVINGLLARAQLPWTAIDKNFYCTLSIGIVRFPEANVDSKEIIKNADIAMYQAKKTGKNNYVFHANTLDNDSVARAEIEKDMREAIENDFDGITVYYQPLVSMEKRILGAEALIRWRLPEGKWVSPGSFIPLAEYLGLIIPMGEFVLRMAARTCRKINETRPDFFMSVNISMRQFQQHDFLERVMRIIEEEGANKANMVFEITEGMAMNDIQRVKILCEEFRRHGIRIAMDDFGTGYSSLGNMRELPIDVVKIDRAFINDVTTDAYSKTFIRLISDLVHSMGRTVCIEGVETAGQMRYCRDCSADYVQGFFLWRPMPEDELEEAVEVDMQGKG